MVERVLLGNDINVSWNVPNANFGSTVKLYINDAIGKRQLGVVVSSVSKLSFKLAAGAQVLGKVRLEIYWTNANINRRIVANNVLEFVDNPENVTTQSENIVSNITLNTVGVLTKVTVD